MCWEGEGGFGEGRGHGRIGRMRRAGGMTAFFIYVKPAIVRMLYASFVYTLRGFSCLPFGT